MIEGKLYNAIRLRHGYSSELDACIKKACSYCITNTFGADDEKLRHPLMMLGQIQSGKTRAFTGLIALAFDNKFDLVFILTKNSKALVQQTLTRMNSEFHDAINNNEVDVKNIIKMSHNLSGYELDKKLIVVSKKEKNNLNKIVNFIEDYSINKNKNCLIIDDEADTTGIGYGVDKRTNELWLRTIAQKVNVMRGNLDGCVFVQVTATPYALYLQPEFNEEDEPKPVKPKQTIIVPPGEGYVGGRYYFIDSKDDNNPAHYLYHEIDSKEHRVVSLQKRKGRKSPIDDRRVIKFENIIAQETTLPTLKRGIVNFIVGAIVLRQDDRNGHYSFVIHTATQKDSHSSLMNAAKEIIRQIKTRTDTAICRQIESLVSESYADIMRSVIAYGFNMPNIDIIRHLFYEAIDKDYCSIDIVNSENDIDILLNQDSGELKLRTPFSIFVGGQVLDRGVTIPKLIGFYYGRSPKVMQQDTVLQHSRMLGYRSHRLLSVTRFYTTEQIHNTMELITEVDMTLRNDIINNRMGDGVYFITYQPSNNPKNIGKVVPCSPAKIKISDVILLKPHRSLLPVGFTPVQKKEYDEIHDSILKILKPSIGAGNMWDMQLAIKEAECLIHKAYATLISDENASRFYKEIEFITTLRYMVGLGNKDYIPVVARINKNNSKYRQTGRLEDSPATGDYELKHAHELATDTPVLLLLQETGNDDKWHHRPFWWPILVAPSRVPVTLYASKNPSEPCTNRPS